MISSWDAGAGGADDCASTGTEVATSATHAGHCRDNAFNHFIGIIGGDCLD